MVFRVHIVNADSEESMNLILGQRPPAQKTAFQRIRSLLYPRLFPLLFHFLTHSIKGGAVCDVVGGRNV